MLHFFLIFRNVQIICFYLIHVPIHAEIGQIGLVELAHETFSDVLKFLKLSVIVRLNGFYVDSSTSVAIK
jgi:hypothetical protein